MDKHRMLHVYDYSSRRGAMVRLLPQIYELLSEAARDLRQAPVAHYITWHQQFNIHLVDINWRFFVAEQDRMLVGFVFYRYADDCVYIEEFVLASFAENKAALADAMIKKFESDPKARGAVFYAKSAFLAAGESLLKREAPPEDWQKIGSMSQAQNMLRLSSLRTESIRV